MGLNFASHCMQVETLVNFKLYSKRVKFEVASCKFNSQLEILVFMYT